MESFEVPYDSVTRTVTVDLDDDALELLLHEAADEGGIIGFNVRLDTRGTTR